MVAAPFTQYFPIVLYHAPFGAQIEGRVKTFESRLAENRVYQWSLKWRDWSTSRALYEENAATLAGHPQIITIKVVPEEYRLWPGFVGSPPRKDAYPELAKFVQEIVYRFNPETIELFNEPNVLVSDAFAPECFGAWVEDDWYGGGKRYGECVKYVYEHVTGARLLAGALMMHPNSMTFLKGALAAGMRPDGISYHTYIRHESEFGKFIENARAIRQLTNLPLTLTETSVLGDGSPAHIQRKIDYLYYLRDNAAGYVNGWNWYTIGGNGWEDSDLDPQTVWEVWKSL